jgi:DNA polymerase-1
VSSPAVPLPPAGADDVVYIVDFSAQSRRRWKGMERDPQALHLKPLANGEPGGVTRSMLGWLVDVIRDRKPAYLVFCLDHPEREHSWRRLALPEYKAAREERPAALVVQEDRIAEVLRMHGIPTYIQRAYEADDLIACVTEQALSYGLRVVIVGFDKDLLPLLANPGVMMWDGKEPTVTTATTVLENVDKWYGCGPEHVADILALSGDSGDGIDGLDGIGIKGAAKLLLKYGSLEEVLRKATWLPPGKVRESLIANAGKARLYRRVTQLAADAPVNFEPGTARLGWTSQEAAAIDRLYRALGFPWVGLTGMPKRSVNLRRRSVPPAKIAIAEAPNEGAPAEATEAATVAPVATYVAPVAAAATVDADPALAPRLAAPARAPIQGKLW